MHTKNAHPLGGWQRQSVFPILMTYWKSIQRFFVKTPVGQETVHQSQKVVVVGWL